MAKKLVYGVGVNDADYVVSVVEAISNKGEKQVQRVVWKCPYYQRWMNMLMRCYSPKYQARQTSYVGCSVCDEWLLFSNFKNWMMTQQWEGKALDKDILCKGNRVYSPDFCVFVDQNVNSLLADSAKKRGEFPIGVSLHKESQRLLATCLDGRRKKVHLGFFDNADDAHEAWRKYKHELACKLAETQVDVRVKNALKTRDLASEYQEVLNGK